jgi:voltage-gated potassium channel
MIIEEDYSFVEAFYMTVITISTVGFREVHELGPSGMVFTSFLIITSIGTFAYTISAVTPLVVLGDASVDERLLAAGLERAKAIICTLPRDADNLYAVLAAREINPGIKVISRASRRASVKKLRTAGADNVIMPDTVGGAHMASLVATPDVMDFLDHVRIQGKGEINLEEIDFRDLPPDFRVPTLGELDARNRIGVNIIRVKTTDGEFLINPGPSTKLDNASKLFVLGNETQIELLNRLFGFQARE